MFQSVIVCKFLNRGRVLGSIWLLVLMFPSWLLEERIWELWLGCLRSEVLAPPPLVAKQTDLWWTEPFRVTITADEQEPPLILLGLTACHMLGHVSLAGRQLGVVERFGLGCLGVM